MEIKRGDTVSKGNMTGTVVAASEGGVVVRWNSDITLEQAADLAHAKAPDPTALSPEVLAALRSWQVPD